MADAIRVLHVEDDPEFAALTREFLEQQEAELMVESACDAAEAAERVDPDHVDCIVSDYDMPGTNGIQFLDDVRGDYPDLPFILFTGKGSEEVASGAISRGVTDYLQKGTDPSQFAVLANRITNAVDQYRSKHALEASQRRLSLFVEQSPLGVIEWDGEFRFVRLNSAAEDILGYVEDELLDEPWNRIVPESQHASRETIVDALLADTGGYHHVNRNVTKDGEVIVCEWHNRVITDESGDVVAGFSQFQDITDRRERERALQEQERRFQAVFHDPNILVGLLHVDGTVLDINQTAMDYVAVELDDIVGTPFWETPWFDHDPTVRETVREWVDRAADGEYVEFETDLVQPDGKQYTIQGVFRPVTNEAGEVVSLLVSDRDITTRKQRERELEQTNAMLSTLFDTLPVGVIAEDASRQILSANQHLFDLFGLPGSPDNIVGRDCESLLEEFGEVFARPETFINDINAIVRGDNEEISDEIELADGRIVLRSYSPIGLSNDNGHLWVYRDVTDRTQYEDTIKALHRVATDLAKCETAAEVYDETIAAAGSLLEFDRAVIATAEDDLLHVRAMSDDVPLDERPTMRIDEGLAGRTYTSGEPMIAKDAVSDEIARPQSDGIRAGISVPIGDHGVFQVVDNVAGTFDERDMELARLLVRHVETALDLVNREQELHRQTERQESFANVVSHDLRNPLNVAAGRLDLLRDEYDSEHIDGIAQSHQRMYELIEDLLTLARSGQPVREPEPINLAAISQRCWENVKTGDATFVAETDVTLLADTGRTKQLLENLFRNAIDHGGSDVTVHLGDLDGGFFVADDGPGVSTDIQERIFESGYSAGSGGAGFGLAIVADIASAHEWEISVTSSEAGGARFELTGIETAN